MTGSSHRYYLSELDNSGVVRIRRHPQFSSASHACYRVNPITAASGVRVSPTSLVGHGLLRATCTLAI
jgi:hypothetical protein